MAQHFTTRWLDAQLGKRRATSRDVFEADGFGVRLAPAGGVSFVHVYREKGSGRRARITLGAYPGLGLAEARKLHASQRACLQRGEDPRAEWARKQRAAAEAVTVDALVTAYVADIRTRLKSWRQSSRYLETELRPRLGRMRAVDVKPADIDALLAEIVERGAVYSAGQCLSAIGAMWTWALARPRFGLKDNPTTGLAKAKIRRRDNVLTGAELVTFWRGLNTTKMQPVTKLALRLQLVTGQRVGEVLAMEWREIDFAKRQWIIPAAKYKGGRAHLVVLSDLALGLLREARRLAPHSALVFPGRTGKALEVSSVGAALKRGNGRLCDRRLTSHDLRRSHAAGLKELGVSLVTIGEVLGHADRTLTRLVYAGQSLLDFVDEKRQAAEAWERHLIELLPELAPLARPADVVPLHGGRRHG